MFYLNNRFQTILNTLASAYFVGCGIRFPSGMKHSSAVSGSATDGAPIPVQVFFTRNGKELPSDGHNMQITLPPHGFFPAISMNQSGEEVSIKLPGSGVRWAPEEDIMMLVDRYV